MWCKGKGKIRNVIVTKQLFKKIYMIIYIYINITWLEDYWIECQNLYPIKLMINKFTTKRLWVEREHPKWIVTKDVYILCLI